MPTHAHTYLHTHSPSIVMTGVHREQKEGKITLFINLQTYQHPHNTHTHTHIHLVEVVLTCQYSLIASGQRIASDSRTTNPFVALTKKKKNITSISL